MMYPYLLFIHSVMRWLVLGSLLYAIYTGYRGWLQHAAYTKRDDTIRHVTATVAHVQLITAICLYSVSPLIRYFWGHYREAVHDRDIRFFGMEHSLMMLIAITIITIGSALAKRKKTDQEKFRTMAIWYTLGLLVILSSVPWPFSPLVSRPWLRGL